MTDSFFEERAKRSGSNRTALQERLAVLRTLAANHLPPEITVMHMGITENPHHDTAGIQHFMQHNLFPWLKENTTLSEAHLLFRSDGCAGQMKSGRHFRFISNFHTFDWSMGAKLVWSHFESCHGKGLNDPECGRAKYILRCHEMRHTAENPTELKSAWECYLHLEGNHTGLTLLASQSNACYWQALAGLYKRRRVGGFTAEFTIGCQPRASGHSGLWLRSKRCLALALWRAISS